jgi:hypothetical protein
VIYLHKKTNLCLVLMRDDLKMYHVLSVIAAATTLPKISEKNTYPWFDGANLRSSNSSRIRPLLTKVAIESCHVDQDQRAEGLLLGDPIGTIG